MFSVGDIVTRVGQPPLDYKVTKVLSNGNIHVLYIERTKEWKGLDGKEWKGSYGEEGYPQSLFVLKEKNKKEKNKYEFKYRWVLESAWGRELYITEGFYTEETLRRKYPKNRIVQCITETCQAVRIE